jgi:hypothetical protein
MIVRRIRGPHDRRGFAVVEMVVTATVLALVVGVFVDVIVVSARKPAAAPVAVSSGEAELAIAQSVSKDVLPSLTATTRTTACGIPQAALVTTQKSTPTARTADETVAYSAGPGGLTRTTCVTGKTTAPTTTLVSADVTAFAVSCRAPGSCGTVHIDAETATTSGSPHPFALDITRKQ